MTGRGRGRKERLANKRRPPPPPGARRRLRIPVWVAALVLLIVLALALWLVLRLTGGAEGAATTPLPPPGSPPNVTSSAADFVGSSQCASCHAAEYATWQRSTHAAAGGVPGAVQMIAPFDGTPIRFRDAEVIPRGRGNTFTFAVRQGNRPQQIFRVDGVIGGGHMQGGGTQGFVSRYDDGTIRFLPFDFIRRENTWFCNTNQRADHGWVPITRDLALADCGDWPPSRVLGDELRFANCQSCHGSQIAVTLDSTTRSYNTTFTTLAINCESCHGPGRRHIDLVTAGATDTTGEIGMRALAMLPKDASLGVCWQCHALKDQLAAGFRSGDDLTAFYSTLLPILGDDPFYPDGRVRTFAYQQGHLYSDCYRNGSMTCTTCHDPHSQGYRDVAGAPLPGRFDDRQCTSCHASKAVDPTAHTRHPTESAGSRCVACHMPYLQEPEIGTTLRYARSDHSIAIPRPAFDSSLGVVSACLGCHQARGVAALEQQTRDWYGTLKPHPRAISALLRTSNATDADAAAELLLVPDESHAPALVDAIGKFAGRHLEPDMASLSRDVRQRLEGLAGHTDIDVRALALASLHYAAGSNRAVRSVLERSLTSAGSEEWPLRRRWAVVLGFFADRLRARGNAAASVTVYRKAREVDPASARVILNMGIAQNESGDAAGALQSFNESITRDPLQPLAYVNMGIAYEAQNNLVQAARAYRGALALNEREPLAYFNLGNVYVKSDSLDQALAMYQRARELDPSISQAHFMVARIQMQRRALKDALAAVEHGLEFDRANTNALAMRDQLRSLLQAPRQ